MHATRNLVIVDILVVPKLHDITTPFQRMTTRSQTNSFKPKTRHHMLGMLNILFMDTSY